MRPTSKRLALLGAAVLTTVTTFAAVRNQAEAVVDTPDKVVLVLGLGNSGSPSYWRWVPGNQNAAYPTSFTQSITGGGGCADPNFSSPTPLVLLGALPSTALATAYNGRMGVCYTNPNYAIDSGETLILRVGTAGPMVGRYFNRVDLSLQQVSNQFPNNGTWQMQATMLRGGVEVGTQLIAQSGNSPVVKTIQQITGGSVVNFDELRLATVAPPSGAGPSISVSGGTSKQPVQTTFYLNDLLCPGETITTAFTDGSSQLTEASATNIGTACKSYSSFVWVDGRPDDDSLPPAETGPPAHLVFDTTSDPNARVRIAIDWGVFDECVPNAQEAVSGDPPGCKVTYVNTFDPDEWNVQTFCSSASVTQPWCTVEKHYTYETVNGETKTHISEVWEGFGDPWMW